MTAYIFDLSPDRQNGELPSYSMTLDRLTETGRAVGSWEVSGNDGIFPGADAWLLLRGGQGRGLIGHGTIASEPYPGATDSDGVDDGRRFADVAVDALLQWGGEIPAEVLIERLPKVRWNTEPGAAVEIPSENEAAVRFLWAQYAPVPLDPTTPPPGTLPENALATTPLNRYEWDPHAREACISHHGTSCSSCGFSFEAVYGDIGKGFIQVHHIVPVSLVDGDYELDPLTDLVPLCPNCHAMAHRRKPVPYTPAELRTMISRAGYLQGALVSPEEQQAQEDAARLLGPGTSNQ
ncbi:HNH endonuclease [Arthrobacter sp. H14]|uniref:HNH endonuclease n=1 Tax=Arthrobacter sp. H14 TaxID=1312959 RepID=UPI0004B5DDF1|nr:HNH endonuclease [Arthrobacter sp. H14]